jgi:hypothetical protein
MEIKVYRTETAWCEHCGPLTIGRITKAWSGSDGGTSWCEACIDANGDVAVRVKGNPPK